MSGTRSPSLKAPATESGSALIVAHGSPSAPEGPERTIRRLAERVSGYLPAWRICGATLAAEGAVETALEALGDSRPGVFPFFMADGWFVRKMLPQRLRRIRGDSFAMVPPLGLDPALSALCLDYLVESAQQEELKPEDTTVLLAAHGSPTDPRPRRAVERMARAIDAAGRFRALRLGYIDERPSVAEAARIDGPAICLPLFAGRGGHVERDLPEALAGAAFAGPLLDPIGQRPEVARIVAAALWRNRALVPADRLDTGPAAALSFLGSPNT